MEAIILAGGLGTRLRGVIGESPKCMAPVAGKPFIQYLFRYLEREGCTRCVLSLGYKSEVVLNWLQSNTPSFEVTWVIEEEPLGTGGGILLALQATQSRQVFVLNGDTLFDVSLQDMAAFHSRNGTIASLALKPLHNFDRYGVVETNETGLITAFREKHPCSAGSINGGVYCLDRKTLLSQPFPQKFSFEKEFLEPQVVLGNLSGYTSEGYFIDIGIPEDYDRAQTEVPALIR
jgi:D-glycero-alpha-D-manno-heptose 1-phosphate guanylyltransferase